MGMMHISELYGIDIYSEGAKYVGKVNDIILNLETGKIVRLTTEPLRSVSKEKAKEVLKEKSVLYKNVSAVGDIVILGASSGVVEEGGAEAKPSYTPRRSLLGRTK
ncbi:MAG: PRC-barrel domain-containing protein [Candidatus Diapherotrites archaeon]|nr:PRC-barrel domain-containing protein [Candidatus Diapherotrites archaeon]